MANSKITITFLRKATPSEFIQFETLTMPANQTNILVEVWKKVRNQSYIVPESGTFGVPGVLCAAFYAYYFGIDYNSSGVFIVTNTENVVTIESKTPHITFQNPTYTPGLVTTVIENSPTTALTLNYAVIEPGTIPCNNMKLTIETSLLITSYVINRVLYPNAVNPFTLEFPRGIEFSMVMSTDSHSIDNQTLRYPTTSGQFLLYGILSVANTNISIIATIQGATVSATVSNAEDLILSWQLQGDVDWQPIHTPFTGQIAGNYIANIRDQYGCQISVPYTVTSLGTRTPYLFISKANSLSFVEYADWDGCSVYKNDENTLEFQSQVYQAYCEDVLFQTCDPLTIQFHSNYDTPTATLRKQDGADVDLEIFKKTANLSKFKSMDCWVYSYKSGYTGIYFESGDTYDENGFPITDGEYSLNGNLPEFAIIGAIVGLSAPFTAYYEIVDVVFDENINKKAIIVKNSYGGAHVTSVASSIYDLLPFEVYEFSVNWAVQGAGIYDIVLNNTDSLNGTVFHVTENINVAIKHEDTVAVRYYNSNNRDIFYLTGIQNFIRVPISNIVAVPRDVTEINITDDNADVTKSVVGEANEFHFDTMTSSLMRKLAIATSCEYLFLQDIGYVKDGALLDEPVENTNLHDVKVLLIKKGVNYTNNRTETDEFDDNTGFNIPAFITSGNGFIKS